MSKNKTTSRDPGEEDFVSARMEEGEGDTGSGCGTSPSEELLREVWAGLTKAQRYNVLAQIEAYRILREFPDIPKHSVNEPSDCLAAKVQHFLEKRYGEKYSKKHIADRFLNDLIRPQK